MTLAYLQSWGNDSRHRVIETAQNMAFRHQHPDGARGSQAPGIVVEVAVCCVAAWITVLWSLILLRIRGPDPALCSNLSGHHTTVGDPQGTKNLRLASS